MHRVGASHWFSFLEEEGDAQEGLFCLYELQKSPRVVQCCAVLLERLPAFLAVSPEPVDTSD
jgi:hypothetical protein